MEFLYNYNALPFLSEKELILKKFVMEYFSYSIQKILKKQNAAWQFFQIEAPSLIPQNFIHPNYTDEDVFVQQNFHKHPDNQNTLVLKPETTASSYLYAEHLLRSQQVKLPVCVWQASKSFRREQDQETKHCRFKEFTHLEFQCIYSSSTQNNYQLSVIEDVAKLFAELTNLEVRIIKSDRLPTYSEETLDIEVFNHDKWMEVCSVSVRNDFTYKPTFNNKQADCKVLEIATSLDRILYNMQISQKIAADKIQNLL